MRLDQLTFTRFIAAVSIVIYHFGNRVFPFKIKGISFLFEQANIGVSYFFILSGFVMCFAYGKKNKIEFLDFLKRRFARIYPVYFLAIFLLLIIFIINNTKIETDSLFYNILMIQAWIPGKALSFNYPGWSLSVELFFYATFPFLSNFFYKKFSLLQITVAVFIFFIISQLTFHFAYYSTFYEGFRTKSHDLLFYFPILHLNEFLLGNIAGIFFIQKAKFKNYDLSILLLVTMLFLTLKYSTGIIFHNGMLAILFIPLIFLIAANTGIITKFFNNKYLVFLGEISFGIYILQFPVYEGVTMILNYFQIEGMYILFYIYLIILIIVSAVSYQFIESPIRKKINSIKI